MSKVVSKRSRNFAKSLFAVLAKEDYSAVSQALNALEEAWSDDPAIASFFANPAVKVENKKSVIQELAGVLANQKLVNMLLILVDSSKLKLLPEITTEYAAIYQNYLESLQLEITTASSLDDSEKQEITQTLKQGFGTELKIDWSVDKDLIGGFTVKSGDSLLDSSVSGRLEKFKASLLQ